MHLRGAAGADMATSEQSGALGSVRRDADEIFHEFTRSVCPVCLRSVDAQVLL